MDEQIELEKLRSELAEIKKERESKVVLGTLFFSFAAAVAIAAIEQKERDSIRRNKQSSICDKLF